VAAAGALQEGRVHRLAASPATHLGRKRLAAMRATRTASRTRSRAIPCRRQHHL